jgi:hypothetical protein
MIFFFLQVFYQKHLFSLSCLMHVPTVFIRMFCMLLCMSLICKHVRLTNSYLFLVSESGVKLSPLGTSATISPTVPAPDYRWWCGAVGGMRIGRGNRNTKRKPAPVPICQPQISHDLTWDRTQAASVVSRWITAWAVARPQSTTVTFYFYRWTYLHIVFSSSLIWTMSLVTNSKCWQVYSPSI